MKYLPHIACIGFILYIVFMPNEVEVIDRTDYFQAKVDSLKSINESYLLDIQKLDETIKEKDQENDSLLLFHLASGCPVSKMKQ